MRYLKLAADYGEVSLRDEQTGPQKPTDLGLPPDLIADITRWNECYQPVIPADVEQRRVDPMASLIGELDQAGVELAERIADALEDEAKVSYYSEGLLREVT
ncbi:MAG: hypothetical protein QOJ97_1912 [Solirubrobacteraceae bacterium]|jgi:hypothetical protein|nr:hypothetical protein [Solirubrobacteraceae bacterium]